jgi:hypothetical protein
MMQRDPKVGNHLLKAIQSDENKPLSHSAAPGYGIEPAPLPKSGMVDAGMASSGVVVSRYARTV